MDRRPGKTGTMKILSGDTIRKRRGARGSGSSSSTRQRRFQADHASIARSVPDSTELGRTLRSPLLSLGSGETAETWLVWDGAVQARVEIAQCTRLGVRQRSHDEVCHRTNAVSRNYPFVCFSSLQRMISFVKKKGTGL